MELTQNLTRYLAEFLDIEGLILLHLSDTESNYITNTVTSLDKLSRRFSFLPSVTFVGVLSQYDARYPTLRSFKHLSVNKVFRLSALHGNIVVMTEAIKRGADFNEAAIFYAWNMGYSDMADLILSSFKSLLDSEWVLRDYVYSMSPFYSARSGKFIPYNIEPDFIGDSAIEAVTHGHLDLLIWMLPKGDRPYDSMLVCNSLMSGQRKIYDYLKIEFANTVFSAFDADLDERIVISAAIGNQEDIVDEMLEKRRELCQPALEGAVQSGNESLVKKLLQKGAKKSDSVIGSAAMGGNIEIFKLVFDKSCNFDNAMEQAITHDSELIIRFMLDEFPEKHDYQLFIDLGIGMCKLSTIKFLVKLAGHDGILIDFDFILVDASRTGRLDIVKYSIEMGATEEIDACNEAFDNDYYNVMRYFNKREIAVFTTELPTELSNLGECSFSKEQLIDQLRDHTKRTKTAMDLVKLKKQISK
jgi:hypothetical protein